jgi:hypothetical protein
MLRFLRRRAEKFGENRQFFRKIAIILLTPVCFVGMPRILFESIHLNKVIYSKDFNLMHLLVLPYYLPYEPML